MKKTVLISLIALLPIVAAGQRYRVRHAIVPATISTVQGLAWGLNQTLEHHNGQFFKVFPGASKKWFGPDSWKNKYWQFDPEQGRNRTPIWFTDAKHFTASVSQVAPFFTGITIVLGKKRPIWHYLIDAGISAITYTAGNYVTYDMIKHYKK